MSDLVLWLDQLRLSDLGKVGGKNASLGEMIGNLSKLGVSVPGGFATTSDAFQKFIAQSGLAERIQKKLADLNVSSLDMVEVIFALEDRFGIQLPFNANTSANDMQTVGDVIAMVEKQLPNK